LKIKPVNYAGVHMLDCDVDVSCVMYDDLPTDHSSSSLNTSWHDSYQL